MRAVFNDSFEKELLLDFFKDVDKGVYVDVGGNLPENSVTSAFDDMGWDGLIIEPIPKNVKAFIDNGRKNIWEGAVTSPIKAKNGTATFFLAGGYSGAHSSLENDLISPTSRSNKTIEVALSTVDIQLKEKGITNVDLLSIDTEGTEVDVLLGTNLNSLSVSLVLVEDWARDFSIHNHMKKRGYKLVRRTGFNSWYVSKEKKI